MDAGGSPRHEADWLIYLAIGDEFAADLCQLARRKIGFHMRNWIIWHYTFGQQTRKKFAKKPHAYFSTSRSKNRTTDLAT